jgi:hypothetical protein
MEAKDEAKGRNIGFSRQINFEIWLPFDYLMSNVF